MYSSNDGPLPLSSSQPIPGWEPTQYPLSQSRCAPDDGPLLLGSQPITGGEPTQFPPLQGRCAADTVGPWPTSPAKDKTRQPLRTINGASHLAIAGPTSPTVFQKSGGTTAFEKSSKKRLRMIEEALSERCPPAQPTTTVPLNNEPTEGTADKHKDKKQRTATEIHDTSKSDKTKFSAVPSTNRGAKWTPDVRQQVKLTEEQRHVLQTVIDGKNVFFTGSAGTGKSVLLREIVKALRDVHKASGVAITATTGLAASNIGGVTIHSFGGIGVGKGTVDELIKQIKGKQKMTNWTTTTVLVIDEISMLQAELFDKVVMIARKIRRNEKGMGGIQLVITGDFFQLPPVTENGQKPVFAFDSKTWNEVIDHSFLLRKVFRQGDDSEFVNMLNEMRLGTVSEETNKTFMNLSRKVDWNDGIEPTQLFPKREEVANANKKRLESLQGTQETYMAEDKGPLKGSQKEKTFAQFMAVETLELKIGCQVMLIKNLDDTLVNGSMGKVVAFRTIAQQYRVTAGSTAVDNIDKDMTARRYPVVRFELRDALQNKAFQREKLLEEDRWRIEGPKGELIAERAQIPLILSWAMSIHKSQGQTLERVMVDLGSTFEKGQAYVALSRATSLNGLQVLNFKPDKVFAHKRVIDWAQTLETVVANKKCG